MTTTLIDDPVLVRFSKALDEMYGDPHRGSDYDVAAFLHDIRSRDPGIQHEVREGTRRPPRRLVPDFI
ncbi:MAG TPA: hypothetical protein VKQ27_10125 [Acetobacteraceae bacterium]|nr:hypothetical protein [Acetobacteraceae bacterium]